MNTNVYTTEDSSVSTRKDDSPVMSVPSGNLRGFGANSSDIPSGVSGRGVTPVPPCHRHPSIGGQIGPYAVRKPARSNPTKILGGGHVRKVGVPVRGLFVGMGNTQQRAFIEGLPQ